VSPHRHPKGGSEGITENLHLFVMMAAGVEAAAVSYCQSNNYMEVARERITHVQSEARVCIPISALFSGGCINPGP
jgi:hypothetical protein